MDKMRKRACFEKSTGTNRTEANLEMRHRRLGHLGFDNVLRLSTSGKWKLKKNQKVEKKLCDICTRANLKRSTVTKGFEKEILTIESLITSQRVCRSCDPSNVLLDSDVSGSQRRGKAG
jgi:hypothetical protein